jgi:phosphoglycolate phosphatase
MLPRPRMVLIDVDGTLVDSVPDLLYCVNEMMQSLGLDTRGEEAVRTWVGNGVEMLVKRSLANDLSGACDADLLAKALPIFEDLYADNTSKRSALYPGVVEGLDWLRMQGLRVGCVTNKAERFTQPLLHDLGIADRFELIISGDTLSVKKPDPGPLLHGAKFFGVEPQDALMIGDSISDVKAARAAGFRILCMSYGYNHGEDIRDYHPDAVIDSMAEFSRVIDVRAAAA